MPRGAEFSIAAEYAQLVWPFVSRTPEMQFITGFRVERHPNRGALIIGTDGKSIGIFWDELAEVKVPSTVKLSKTTLAACAPGSTLVLTGDRASVYQMWNAETGEGLLVAAQDSAVIDADYPNWRSVVPRFPVETVPSTFSFTELKKFEKVRRFGSKVAVIRVFAENEEHAAVVLTDREDFLGVMLPFRSLAEENRMPSWMPRPEPTVSAGRAEDTAPGAK